MTRRDHAITTVIERRPDGGMDMVCGTCRRPVGTVAFEASEPILVEGRELGRTRVIRDFMRHYDKAATQ